MTILDALRDLFGGTFRPDLWAAWIVALKAIFGLPMTAAEVEVFRAHTGRSAPPHAQAREGWLVVGRRGGKSRIAALVAVWLACFRDYAGILAPGERGTLMVIAADRRQARTVMRYINGLLDAVPMLSALVESRTREAIHLTNRVTIEVHTASFRATRGYTVIGAILDEIAFWRVDEGAAEPDREILAAIRPGMATVPGAMLVAISSPYARKGELYRSYEKHFGRDGDPVLVWQADTRSMNPTVGEDLIARAFAEDEIAAWSEYGRDGEIRFRLDVESFVAREVVEACVVPGRHELPWCEGVTYCGFVDPSGGSQDSFTLAIAHEDKSGVVLDALREVRPPFSPDAVVADFSALLLSYGVTVVRGDRYAGEWPRERFILHGVLYQPEERPKSVLYGALLPLLNSGGVELLDTPRLLAQLVGLERRTARGGRDSIDHAPRAHDDVANAVAGAIVNATASAYGAAWAVAGGPEPEVSRDQTGRVRSLVSWRRA